MHWGWKESPVAAAPDDASTRSLDSPSPAPAVIITPHIARLPGAAPFTFGGGQVWAAASSAGDGSKGFLARIDPKHGSLTKKRPFGLILEDVEYADGSLWVSATSGACVVYSCGMGGDEPPPQPRFPRENSITKWDAETLTIQVAVPVQGPYRLEVGLGAVWVTRWGENRTAELVALDPETGARLHRFSHRGDPGEVVLVGGWVWELAFLPRTHSRPRSWTLFKVDPSTGWPVGRFRLEEVRQGDPMSLDAAAHTVWVTSFFGGDVYGVDITTGQLRSSSTTGLRIQDVSAGPLGLWVVAGGILAKLDGRTGSVLERFRLPGGARLWYVDQTSSGVWVSSRRGIFRYPAL